MATITEDYVSFEIAKLLKEKGFDSEEVGCRGGFYSETCYDSGYGIITDSGQEVGIVYDDLRNADLEHDEYLRPTLQMAMKWLREVHNLSVEVYRTACGYVGCIVSVPSGSDVKFLEETGDDLSSGQYTKWEYACEATIKYCLEHLIHIAKKSK